jgi:hypothetical protein
MEEEARDCFGNGGKKFKEAAAAATARFNALRANAVGYNNTSTARYTQDA